jgi:RNA polymerase sigma-70 factor (ECF subfamily)
MSAVVRHLRRVARHADGAGESDGHLLECFLARRDEVAFESLVRRHGPMVLGVCRRALNNTHDAEDAFQATFLVLARKAASVRPRELLANWLYGVACNTARKARALARKRRSRERQVIPMPEPEAPRHEGGDDLRPLLDCELCHLPAKYRAPVVLCDLEGKTRKEAAESLGWPEGTVSGRLARARQMLAKRLARRGVTLSAAGLALLRDSAEAGLPNALVVFTVEAATRFAAGQSAAAAGLAPRAAFLTEGVLQAMRASRFKIAAVVLLLTGLIFVGEGVWAHRPTSNPQGKIEQAPAAGAGLDPLQGIWRAVSAETVNHKFPPEKVRHVRLLVKGDRYALEDGTAREEGVLSSGGTKAPNALDLTPVISSMTPGDVVVRAKKPAVAEVPKDGRTSPVRRESETSPGFYEVRGDTLKLCLAAPGMKRPAGFRAGPREMMLVFKREPQKEAKPAAFIGRIAVVGNGRVPSEVIMRKIGLMPGAPLDYPALHAAEKRLAELGLFVVDEEHCDRPTISLGEFAPGSPYRDVVISVREKDRGPDEKAIQGEWEVVAGEHGGRAEKAKSPRGRGAHALRRVVFRGKEVSAVVENGDGTTRTNRATFRLYPDKTPPWIDLQIPDVETEEGIYFVFGDELWICFRDGGRPSQFDTRFDPGATGYSLRRVKAPR